LAVLAQKTHTVLSAFLSALAAALLVWIVLHGPEMAAANSRAAVLREAELAAQDRIFCENWGLPSGSHEHTLCTLDLKKMRDDQERRRSEDVAGIL